MRFGKKDKHFLNLVMLKEFFQSRKKFIVMVKRKSTSDSLVYQDIILIFLNHLV